MRLSNLTLLDIAHAALTAARRKSCGTKLPLKAIRKELIRQNPFRYKALSPDMLRRYMAALFPLYRNNHKNTVVFKVNVGCAKREIARRELRYRWPENSEPGLRTERGSVRAEAEAM